MPVGPSAPKAPKPPPASVEMPLEAGIASAMPTGTAGTKDVEAVSAPVVRKSGWICRPQHMLEPKIGLERSGMAPQPPTGSARIRT